MHSDNAPKVQLDIDGSTILHNGEGLLTPNLLTPVDIKYTSINREELLLLSLADLVSRVKLCQQQTVVLGRNQLAVPYCLYDVILTMKRHEVRLIPLTLNSKMKLLLVNKSEISNSHMSGLIEVCSFNRMEDLPNWEPSAKIKEAEIQKSIGNSCFRSQLIAESVYHYSLATKLCILSDLTSTDNTVLKLKLTNLLNLSACWLRFEKYNYVIELCRKVLSHESNNEKALYRQAVALSGLNEFESAITSLNKLIELNPTNTEVVTQLKKVELMKREYYKTESIKYCSLFSSILN